MVELTDAQIDAALERGKVARLYQPRGTAARYDRLLDRIIVELTNGYALASRPVSRRGWKTRLRISLPRSNYSAPALDCTGKRSMPIYQSRTCSSASSERRLSWPDTPGE
jgi:hypothetical protein